MLQFLSPPEAPSNTAPIGWYLAGVIIDPAHRRLGIGLAPTRHRLAWLVERTSRAHYFANVKNGATIELHRQLGFAEITRDFVFPGTTCSGAGVGVLFDKILHAPTSHEWNRANDSCGQ